VRKKRNEKEKTQGVGGLVWGGGLVGFELCGSYLQLVIANYKDIG